MARLNGVHIRAVLGTAYTYNLDEEMAVMGVKTKGEGFQNLI